MVKRTIIFCFILLSAMACIKWHPIRMIRISYTGKDLRMDGYYYTDAYYDEPKNSYSRGYIIFYRNGFCVVGGAINMTSPDDFAFLEKRLIEHVEYATNYKYEANFFKIHGLDIEIEGYQTGSLLERDTFCDYGEILNDTTFVIKKYRENYSGKESEMNKTYHFRHYLPKPDSTCVYMN